MDRVQKVLYHELLDMYEDNRGGWYADIIEFITKNEELFEDVHIEYLMEAWTVRPPKRISFTDPIHWDYEI
jgi:hypothetical protein